MVSLGLCRSALSGSTPVPIVLGGLAVVNAVAGAALGAVFLGAGQYW